MPLTDKSGVCVSDMTTSSMPGCIYGTVTTNGSVPDCYGYLGDTCADYHSALKTDRDLVEAGLSQLLGLVQGCSNNEEKIERIIFRQNRTTVLWADGSHTTVGYMKEDSQPYSRITGLAMCLLKRHFESSELSYRETIKYVFPSALFEPEEVKQIMKDMVQDGKMTEKEYQWLAGKMAKIERRYLDILKAKDCSVQRAMKDAIWDVLANNCPRNQLAKDTA